MARGPSDNCLLCPLTWIAQKLVEHVQKSSLPCSTCEGSVMNNKTCQWSCEMHPADLMLVSNQDSHSLVGCTGILMGFSWTRPLGEQSDEGRLWKMALHWFTKNVQLLQVISRLNFVRGYLWMWIARSACQYWGWSCQSSLYYPFARNAVLPEVRRFHIICLPAMNVRNHYCIQLCLLCLLPHTGNTGNCMAISGVLETVVPIPFQ